MNSKYDGINEEELNRFGEKISSLSGVGKEFSDLSEKYLNFRLQLIAIAGATFSIYIALHANGVPPGIYTKCGFVALAASLLFGVLAILTSFIHRAGKMFYQFFDFDRSAENETEGFKKVMQILGMPQGTYYDKSIKTMEAQKLGETYLRWMRNLLTSTLGEFGTWLGIGQIVAFLLAAGFLLTGLLLL